MKRILIRLCVKAAYFLGLVVFAVIIASLVAWVSPIFFIFIPLEDINKEGNHFAMIVFAVVALLLIVVNFNRNQRAADKFCDFDPPEV